MTEYFFDTYALVSLVEERESYRVYFDAEIVCSPINLLEFHYVLLRKKIADADEVVSALYHNVANIEQEDILAASKLKFKNKKRKLSYADCLGYVAAKRLGIPFLTGDKEFKDLSNVEFAV